MAEFTVVLIGLAVSIITQLSKWTNLSQTAVVMLLTWICGAGYFIFTTYYPIEWANILAVVGGIFASSQFIYLLLKKRWIIDKLDAWMKIE